jgi:hypothetical protein
MGNELATGNIAIASTVDYNKYRLCDLWNLWRTIMVGLVNARRAFELAGGFTASTPIVVGMDPRTMTVRSVYADDEKVDYRVPSPICLYQWADTHDVFCMDRSMRIFDGASPIDGPGLSWWNAIRIVHDVDPSMWTPDGEEHFKESFSNLWNLDPSRAAFFLVRVAEDLELHRLEKIYGDEDETTIDEIIGRSSSMVSPSADDMDVIDASSVDVYGRLKVTDLHMSLPGSWSDWTDDLDAAGMSWGQWLPYRRVVALLGGRPNNRIAGRVVSTLAGGVADWTSRLWARSQEHVGAARLASELSWWIVDRDWDSDTILSDRIASDLLDDLMQLITIGVIPEAWSQDGLPHDSYEREVQDLTSSDEDQIMGLAADTWRGLRMLPSWVDANDLLTDQDDDAAIFDHIVNGEAGAYNADPGPLFRMFEALTWPSRSLSVRMEKILNGAMPMTPALANDLNDGNDDVGHD